MDLQTPLTKVAGIGYSYSKKLEYLNLFTVEDLINHYPFRYDDFSKVASVIDAQIGEKVTLQGEIWSIKNIYTRYGKTLTQAIFNDSTTPITLTWFNSSWIIKQIKTGDRLQVSGKLTKYKSKLSIMAPTWELITSEEPKLTSEVSGKNLVPIYPETYGVSSKWLRTKIAAILPQVKVIDPLPNEIKNNMLALPDALQKIHFPQNWEEAEKAKERLSFDELFFIQLATLKIRQAWQKKQVIDPLKIDQKKLDQFVKKLPFKLTKAQEKVLTEIISDLQKNTPMNRLLQGEVGSGKTVIAAIVSYIVYLNGFKTLFMAPTEILAFQHFETLKKLFVPLKISVGIYTGSKKNQTGDIVVGTHALLSKKLETENIGLIIVDEQQRFGVEQRTLLRSRAKIPHFLTMTATPIPRTVALTLYGDLDISIIDEMPIGRQQVKTFRVPEKKRKDSYKFIAKQVAGKGQVYIITPFIEPSETLVTVKAAKIEFEKLKKIFPHLKLDLLHGRMKGKDKEKITQDFREGKTQILVSTSVVEVGMDNPNATIIIIEGAERFGLAQLHQLRGRVGRGEKESYCLLYTSPHVEDRRLKYLETTFDGLKLAELDLKIRGSGQIFGKQQSGRFELKIASFSDLSLIEEIKAEVQQLLKKNPSLDKYPLLKAKLQDIASAVMPD
ncbi:ATP-dependent DNA helicase RecG [Candidatus Daviesbacteria bacterium RIFCSPLOWO2_01_FULL_38_10]|nr:MAG: helicase protein [Candidatus Daviesbacteria bacterium GW2011_GWA2_38_17]OGE26961.1 MAG: ATP-dependent DNA helicase RecG [Candidatus Daviesbacteria bacterium RIFCSPHIGHO2_02_FULL_39_41]OGE38765.1 MAG: ATP-dependent DNA helicase RecG [Candidatus Daviesbacteria bacterium RIFCSPLOWO2_01_FULL_38_10]OGE44036.1 MAG: ATP-dependent DNA helicase RecG [Candidatus Daviesbacteria bacterium RIFCSPHIGHO2_12_FULL_38_25]OGE67244.1 MAG: ATP-dependent DNA helicase RecG [Candidatus Daviesbacteria bacterium